MGKNRNKCWACNERHYPPTGKNCKQAKNVAEEEETSQGEAAYDIRMDSHSDLAKAPKKVVASGSKSRVAKEKDSYVKKVLHVSDQSQSDTDEGADLMGGSSKVYVQWQILQELKKVIPGWTSWKAR